MFYLGDIWKGRGCGSNLRKERQVPYPLPPVSAVKWACFELEEFDWVEAESKVDAIKVAQLLFGKRVRYVEAYKPPSVRSAQSLLP